MNTTELKPNQKIGVFYHDDNRGAKAKIEEIAKVSPTGYITLKNGKRYNPKGYEVGIEIIDATFLCSVEKAQAIIDKSLAFKQKKEEEYKAYLATPEGQRQIAIQEAVQAAIQILNKYGWYADVDGHMDVMESEIKQIIKKYLSEHEPID
ncbi:MAG: hypothetical protein KME50_37185 [Nostoc desertorum CM1-VF14]|jgi:hypothetical protein|nr:hypothetical protein [Nostoc desertorum CM1-VF14]